MSEWKEYKLGDCIEAIVDNRGKSAPTQQTGEFPLLEINSIGGYYPNYGVVRKYVDEITYKTWFRSGHPESGDILVPTVGTIGIISIMDSTKACIAQNLIALRIKKNISNVFIYYYLKSPIVKKELLNLDIGGVQPSIKVPHLLNLSILLPPKEVQIKIASILSSLDDKIDLLHRENATLEAMAETLFRQWFVEEAKEEWKEGKLGDYVELINGVSYKGDELQPSKVAMVTLKSFDRNGGFRMDGYKEFTGKYKKEQVLHDGDLVVAHTDITQEADVIGNPAIVICKHQYETITFSMDVVKVVSKSEFFSNSFLYYLMKTQTFKEHCLGYANGSTVLHLSKKAIPEFEFRVPPIEMARNFQEQVESFDKKIINNNSEIQTLIQTRDGLLPRLMSGEINV